MRFRRGCRISESFSCEFEKVRSLQITKTLHFSDRIISSDYLHWVLFSKQTHHLTYEVFKPIYARSTISHICDVFCRLTTDEENKNCTMLLLINTRIHQTPTHFEWNNKQIVYLILYLSSSCESNTNEQRMKLRLSRKKKPVTDVFHYDAQFHFYSSNSFQFAFYLAYQRSKKTYRKKNILGDVHETNQRRLMIIIVWRHDPVQILPTTKSPISFFFNISSISIAYVLLYNSLYTNDCSETRISQKKNKKLIRSDFVLTQIALSAAETLTDNNKLENFKIQASIKIENFT